MEGSVVTHFFRVGQLLEIEDFVAAMKPVNFRTRALTALHQTLNRLEETSRNLVNKPAEQEDTKEEEAAVTEQVLPYKRRLTTIDSGTAHLVPRPASSYFLLEPPGCRRR